ncbi:glycosyltransferase family 4 protein [Haladaptatus caseinilyticus]|uniref:glycosyltransferase family 4 protein n=1 Tax=Haladaptatus caseinilyticus TaxID=2993314 RepID=UPI00224A7B4F|nr:glycosyltransferase family 4 protein [Haladaptatus caseinilyticus]
MKIAFIHPSWPGSEGTGATHSATQVAKGLAERGNEVHVFCTEPIDNVSTTEENMTLKYLPAEGRLHHYQYNLKLNHTLKERASEFDKYDIVHSYLTILIPGLEAIGKRTSASTVATLNAYGGVCPKNDLYYLDEQQCKSASFAKCTSCIAQTSDNTDENPIRLTASRLANLKLVMEGKRNLDHLDAFRAPSGHVRENYVRHEFPEDKIQVIPHPLNSDFLVDHRSEFTEPYRLLYVGFLKQKKGVEELIPIVTRLRELTDAQFTLSIVGKGPSEKRMREQTQQLGVEDIVEFRGFMSNEELPNIYANHDLFVYPSLWEEPLGRVYIESLATGTPIVSSAYGSIEEIIGDGGVAVHGGPDSFAHEISSLFSGRTLKEMSAAAICEAQKFRREAVVNRIEKMYEQIVIDE